MGSCVAYNCTNRFSKKIPGVTFHSFPKDEKRRKIWILAVRRENWEPSGCSKLCSKHFPEEMIDRTSVSCVRLRDNAVPSIFDFPSHLKKKKTCPPAAASKPSKPNLEPEVVIKEEPIDIDEPPVQSTSRTDPVLSTSGTDHEFITSFADSFLSGTTPTLGEAFTVIKTEPVDEDDVPQTISNGNTGKASKKKPAEMADVGQPKSPANTQNEDSSSKIRNAKEHVFQCTIGAAYTLVNSGPVVEEQQVVQKPQRSKTSNVTKTQSSQNKTFVEEQTLPVAEDSSITEKKCAQIHLDDYGKYIASELKMLDSKSCAHVQRVIADLLFDAKMGKFK